MRELRIGTLIRESFLGCYRKIKEVLIMKKLMDITTMAMMVLMILGLILCLFGIDVPKDIMVMEFVIMFVSYKVYQIQVKIEKERRRKLKIAKQMREVRL
jgi:hypothetical protein